MVLGPFCHVLLDGSEKSVAFTFRMLSLAENYSQLDKEDVSIIFGVKIFYQYPFRHAFHIITDHKLLIRLFSSIKPTLDTLPLRIIQWSLLISAYDYMIDYMLGLRIVTADAMSCLLLYEILDVLTHISWTIFKILWLIPLTYEIILTRIQFKLRYFRP